MCKVIAICNQKGGVSKTTTTVNLGAGLVREGKKVLVIDADPQGNLSQSLGIMNPDELDVALPDIMEQIIMDKDVDVTEGIVQHEEGLDLMPCNINLSGVDVSLVNAMSREFVLKTYVESMREFYDYILIDCMPSLGMITVNSLTAADSVLIPVQAAYLPVKGLEQLITTICRVKKHLNPSIRFEGILISMLNARTNYAKDIMELINEYYGDSVPIFESKIPFSVKASETSAAGVSIFSLDKKIVLILDYFWKREKELDVKKSEWILMISFPMMTVVIMLVMLLSFQQKNNSFGYLTVSFGMVSINLVMFVLLKYISAREKQYNQMKILQERNKEKMQAYYEFSEDYAQKKRMVHDYNNQIHCIQGLLRQNKYREAEEYADKLTEILIDGREVIDVNNTVLNVVLNQKYRLAKSKDIALYFQVNDLSGLWMKEQDVVILLSNLLDNAIEACEKLDCNKVIRLKLVKEKQQMVLSVQNPVAVPVEIKNNDIQTGKGDKKNHGIGLKNIQMVLDKYGGIGRIRCDKGWFYYTAVIPQTEEI